MWLLGRCEQFVPVFAVVFCLRERLLLLLLLIEKKNLLNKINVCLFSVSVVENGGGRRDY